MDKDHGKGTPRHVEGIEEYFEDDEEYFEDDEEYGEGDDDSTGQDESVRNAELPEPIYRPPTWKAINN